MPSVVRAREYGTLELEVRRATNHGWAVFRRPRIRTPSPSPFSDKNSTPARSNTRLTASTVLVRESTAPCSRRTTELSETIALSASR